jgi:hypothetical protein
MIDFRTYNKKQLTAYAHRVTLRILKDLNLAMEGIKEPKPIKYLGRLRNED